MRERADAVRAGTLDDAYDAIALNFPGGLANVQDVYPLSPLQEGMLFQCRISETSDPYSLFSLFELRVDASVTRFIDAWQEVINRHSAFRTAIVWEKLERPVQVVCRSVKLEVNELQLDPTRDPRTQLNERITARQTRLSLSTAPLFRVEVARAADATYVLVQRHHLICDRASWRIALAEAIEIFRGRASALPVPGNNRAYAEAVLKAEREQDAKDFFQVKLGTIHEVSTPFGFVDLLSDCEEVAESSETLHSDLARRIRAQAKRYDTSPARLFHAAWALVVAQTSGRDDVCFGTVMMPAEGKRALARHTVGMFVNTLPLRVRLAGLSASELLQQVDRELTELLSHAQTPLAAVQSCARFGNDAPVFTSLLNFRHSKPIPEIEAGVAAGVREIERGEARSGYPVAMIVDDLGEAFALHAQTHPNLDPRRVTKYLGTALESLAAALERGTKDPVQLLNILPETERRRLLDDFNSDRVSLPEQRLLHELFEDQVRRTPDALAAVHGDKTLTYRELNSRSNQLAHYLRGKGIKPDRLVGLFFERGLDMLVAIMATWKAGGAYVPLDPAYPGDRLAYMLTDSAPLVVLTQAHLKASLPDSAAAAIALDTDRELIDKESADDLPASHEDLLLSQLAYVIYTSGSTGRPKGVMIEHRSVINLWRGLEPQYCEPYNCSRVALNASLSFDASVQQVVQLLSGRTVFPLPEEERRDPAHFLKFIEDHAIDCVDCTPAQLKMWISAGLLERAANPLRLVLVGGEEIDADLWRRLAQARQTLFCNVYGPTECTVDATLAEINGDLRGSHIGRPMANRRLYVLDSRGQVAPIGVTGELYIGGKGISRGYLGQPALTAERFVVDPFSAEPGARMYKTGDLGCWSADGTLKYFGRSDHQVKVRGYRIELGEIESQLLSHPHVRGAAVIVREDMPGEKRLVAYVTPQARSELTPHELRSHLRSTLPEYMVPNAYVMLDALPITTNGKVDRRALPAPIALMNEEYEAPQGDIEEVLAELWQGLLPVERVGRRDNFFDLGGHSLLATRVVSRVCEQLEVVLPLKAIFEAPRLHQLASRIEAQQGTDRRAGHMNDRARSLSEEIDAMDDEAVSARIRALEKQLGMQEVAHRPVRETREPSAH